MKNLPPIGLRARGIRRPGRRPSPVKRPALSLCPRRGSQRTRAIVLGATRRRRARVYIIYSEPLSSALRQVSHLRPRGCARLRGFDDERSREKVSRRRRVQSSRRPSLHPRRLAQSTVGRCECCVNVSAPGPGTEREREGSRSRSHRPDQLSYTFTVIARVEI